MRTEWFRSHSCDETAALAADAPSGEPPGDEGPHVLLSGKRPLRAILGNLAVTPHYGDVAQGSLGFGGHVQSN